MNDVMNKIEDIFGEDSWYDPSESSSSSIEAGTYTAQVTDLVVKEDKEVQGKFLADIYEPVFNINGKEVRHKGLFRFKKPNPSLYPHLQADMGSNAGYYKFCDSLKIVQEKDGKMFLPQLTIDTLKRYEYKVEVVMEEWTGRDGNNMKTARVKLVTSAQSLISPDQGLIAEEDLPF